MGTLGMCTSKTLLGSLGLLFFIAGLTCITVGSVIINRYYDTVEFTQNFNVLKVPAVLLIFIGFIFFIAGVSGCCNLFRESKGCLASFFVFLFAIVCLLIVAGGMGAAYRGEINDKLAGRLNTSLYKYDNDSVIRHQTDDLQRYFKCCGVHNATDWISTPFDHVPDSCYDTNNSTGHIYEQGCFSKLDTFFNDNFGYIIGGTVGLLVILVLGMVGSCVLYHYKKNENYFTLS